MDASEVAVGSISPPTFSIEVQSSRKKGTGISLVCSLEQRDVKYQSKSVVHRRLRLARHDRKWGVKWERQPPEMWFLNCRKIEEDFAAGERHDFVLTVYMQEPAPPSVSTKNVLYTRFAEIFQDRISINIF